MYEQIEAELTALLGAEDALLLPTITHIHMSAIPVLAGEGEIFLDGRAHKTICDGCVMARGHGATVKRFPHNDLEELERMLQQSSATPRLVALDGVNSMTGNAPDIPAFARLAREYNALLYVDDAHGFGVIGERSPDEACDYGLRGNSIIRHLGETHENVILVGGFSKAYSSLLAFMACPTPLKELLKTAAPPYLYSGPSHVASLATALEGLRVNERNGDLRRSELHRLTAAGVGVLSWVFLIAPQANDGSLPLLTKLTSISYPVMDLLLLAVAVRLAVGAGRRGTSFYLLVGGAAALFATDSIYGWKLLHGGYETGGLLDGGWIAFYALWGAAALHPSMRSVAEPAREPDHRLTPKRLALLAGATMIGPAVQTVRYVLGQPFDALVVTGSSVVLFLLVVARMADLVHRNEQTVAREKALREAGAALVTATSRDGIYEATMNATRSLLGSQCSAVLYWFGDAEGELEMVAASGHEAATAGQLEYAALPEEIRLRLRQRAIAEMDLDGLDHRIKAYLAPLFMRDELRGILVVLDNSSVRHTTKEGLLTLALQVGLALESAALTETLLRNRSEARFRSLFQHSADLVTVVSADTAILYASPSAEEMVGFRPDQLDGRRFSELVHSDELTRLTHFLQAVIDRPRGHSSVIELRLRRADGTELDVEIVATNLVEDPNLRGLVLNTRNVTERKAFEKQLTYQAFHDTVTGLPNRALFKNRVEHGLSREVRDGRRLAVLFLDIDDFKTTNDTLGHAAGDEVLRQIGERLVDSLRGADTVARLGGDEFGILLEGMQDDVRATDVAERMMAALSAPFSIEGKELSIGGSIGIAFGDLDGRGR